MTFDPQLFTVSSNRGVLVRPVLVFEIFLWDTGDGSTLLAFYENLLTQMADVFLYCQKNNRIMPFQGKTRSSVPTWLAHPDLNPQFFFKLMDEEHQAAAASLTMHIKQRHEALLSPARRQLRRENTLGLYGRGGTNILPIVSSLRLTLPVEHPLAQPTHFKPWLLAQALLQRLPFLYAYAGYGLNVYHWSASPPVVAEAWRTARVLAMRHCGLDLPATIASNALRFDHHFFDRHDFFIPLAKRASWLNFFGSLQCAALGGEAAVAARCADQPSLTLTQLEHGLLVQAGEAPALGDLGRHEFLPAYRAVAQLMRPLRPTHFDGFGRAFEVDAQAEWLDGLDRDYD